MFFFSFSLSLQGSFLPEGVVLGLPRVLTHPKLSFKLENNGGDFFVHRRSVTCAQTREQGPPLWPEEIFYGCWDIFFVLN